MFYLAVALILLGLGLLIYYLFAVTGSSAGATHAGSDGGSGRPIRRAAARHRHHGHRQHSAGEPSGGAPASQAKSGVRPESAPAERKPQPAPVQSSGNEPDPTAEIYTRIDPNALADVLVRGRAGGMDPHSEQPAPEPLVIAGVLFLNHGRRLPLPSRIHQEHPSALRELKRVGPATLIVEPNGFLIRAGEASYSYSPADLEQIVFEKRGLALIPVLSNRPSPVFLTDRPDVLKDYIREHAAVQRLHAR